MVWNAFKALSQVAARYPGRYLATCVIAGSLIRLAMAHGDLATWVDPRFPLFPR